MSALMLAACSEDGPSVTPTDAVAVSDRDDATDIQVPSDMLDVGDRLDTAAIVDAGVDATTMLDVTPDRGASADQPDATSTDRPGVVLPEIPTDPLGVPAPGSECTGDAGVRPGDPSIAPPRPILPQSVSRVTSQRPSFRWALPEGTTGARVEVCADRCCTRVIQTLEAEGTTVRPTTTLPPGVVYWRMFGRRAGVTGSRASYTWEFGVRRRDTPVDSSWGTIRDFTGDGYDDVLLSSRTINGDGTRNFYIVEGGVGALRTPHIFATVAHLPQFGDASFGDFNGDGRVDAVYSWGSGIYDHRFDVLQSAPREMYGVVSIDVASVRGADLTERAVVDWNGDGYSDFITTAYFFNESRSSVVGSVLLVYWGSSVGLRILPQRVERLEYVASRQFVGVFGAIGDIDADGYGDVALYSQLFPRTDYGQSILFGHDGGVARSVVLDGPVGPRESIYRVWPVGDQDGDGIEEVVFRVEPHPPLRLYPGSAGFGSTAVSVEEPAGGGGGRDFGDDVDRADLNGDGFADLIVGSPVSTVDVEDAGRLVNAGRVYTFFGGRSGLTMPPVWHGRTYPVEPLSDPYGFGDAISAPGDLDVDGIDDAVIYDSRRGTACLVRGTQLFVGGRLGNCIAVPGQVNGVY